jgi:hypothetical protein
MFGEKPTPTGKIELPARLMRLDRELKIERSLRQDALYAVRSGFRFEICIERTDEQMFVATTIVRGKIHRASAGVPSSAFAKLVLQLRWVTSRLLFERHMSNSRSMSTTSG